MANKIAVLSFQMNIIIPCHAWAKSKHINPFSIYLPSFQREDPFLPSRYLEKNVLNNVLLKLWEQCLYINIPLQTSFDYFWAFGACIPCQLYDTKTPNLRVVKTCPCTWHGTNTCTGLKHVHSTQVLKHNAGSLLHFNKTICWVLRLSFWLSFNICLLSG